jgi:hypothetical protein
MSRLIADVEDVLSKNMNICKLYAGKCTTCRSQLMIINLYKRRTMAYGEGL